MKYLNQVVVIIAIELLAQYRVNAFSTATSMSMSTPTPTPTLTVQTVHYHDEIEMEKCYEVRKAVFVEEQQIPLDIEIDADEKIATHIVATTLLVGDGDGDGDDGSSTTTTAAHVHVVGAARIVYDIKGSSSVRVGKIGRVCVMKEYRGNGYGRAIVLFAVEEIKKVLGSGSTDDGDGGGAGGGMAKLGAQVDSIKFYESMGFEIIPNTSEYTVAGIPHRDMQQIIL